MGRNKIVDTQEKIELIKQRFIHQPNTYAVMRFDPERGTDYRRVIEGECPERPMCPKKTCIHITSIPISDKVIFEHLKGTQTIGVYNLTDDNTVRWLCLDVDRKKDEDIPLSVAQEQTKRVAHLLMKLIGRRFLVERSGDKGYHIWVFFTEPTQARLAYAFGNYVVDNVQIADGIHIEVFPKQTNISSFGNLVKLPLGIHQRTQTRCFFVNSKFEPYENQFELLATTPTLDEKELEALVEAYDMNAPATIRLEHNNARAPRGLPCVSRMMHEGLERGQRDIGMFHIGNFLRVEGFSLPMASAAMHAMNQHNRPPLMDHEIEIKLQSAFSNDYTPYPCNQSSLDNFCSSSCRFFENKVAMRRIGKRNPIGEISRD